MHSWLRRFTFPLRATLVTSVITSVSISILLVLAVIERPIYVKAKDEIHNLWKDLAVEVSDSKENQILLYFDPAPRTLKLIEDLNHERALKPVDFQELFSICFLILKENPTFSAIYYSTAAGEFTGVFRMGSGFIASHRMHTNEVKTEEQTYELDANNRWALKETKSSDYDPRQRPFWQTGTIHPEGSWTNPYRFVTTGALGYTYVLAQTDVHQLEGMWAIDFQIDYLDSFLQSLHMGKEGQIYLIADDGTVVASSTKATPPNQVGAAVKQFISSGGDSRFLNDKNQILYVNRFPKESQIPWNLISIIEKTDFLGPIQRQVTVAIAIGLIPCLGFLILAGLFFGKISKRLKEIAWEMDKAGNFSIRFMQDEMAFSRIREINMMNHSLHKMKMGLCSFAKYVPVDLVKRVLESNRTVKLGGDRREITVLFADLSQFTYLAEEFGSQKITEILEHFLQTVTRAVHEQKGIIDKFIGDACMAIWGAPDRCENHPLAACRAALQLKKLSQNNPRLKHKTGINSGFAMVGNFGSQERMDYTAIGDTVNIAARLEKLNNTYGTWILIGPETALGVQETLLVRPIDWVILHGRIAALLIFELIGEKSEASPALLKGVSLYAEAMDAYRSRRFAQAADLFEEAKGHFPEEDLPCKILSERCRLYEKNPPPEPWDGAQIPN